MSELEVDIKVDVDVSEVEKKFNRVAEKSIKNLMSNYVYTMEDKIRKLMKSSDLMAKNLRIGLSNTFKDGERFIKRIEDMNNSLSMKFNNNSGRNNIESVKNVSDDLSKLADAVRRLSEEGELRSKLFRSQFLGWGKYVHGLTKFEDWSSSDWVQKFSSALVYKGGNIYKNEDYSDELSKRVMRDSKFKQLLLDVESVKNVSGDLSKLAEASKYYSAPKSVFGNNKLFELWERFGNNSFFRSSVKIFDAFNNLGDKIALRMGPAMERIKPLTQLVSGMKKLTKVGLGILGGILALVRIGSKYSGYATATFRLFRTMVALILKPLADLFGMIMLPILVTILRHVLLPMLKIWGKFVSFTQREGKIGFSIGGFLGGVGGFAIGAKIGGGIGSALGPIGMLVGAIVGGLIGLGLEYVYNHIGEWKDKIVGFIKHNETLDRVFILLKANITSVEGALITGFGYFVDMFGKIVGYILKVINSTLKIGEYIPGIRDYVKEVRESLNSVSKSLMSLNIKDIGLNMIQSAGKMYLFVRDISKLKDKVGNWQDSIVLWLTELVKLNPKIKGDIGKLITEYNKGKIGLSDIIDKLLELGVSASQIRKATENAENFVMDVGVNSKELDKKIISLYNVVMNDTDKFVIAFDSAMKYATKNVSNLMNLIGVSPDNTPNKPGVSGAGGVTRVNIGKVKPDIRYLNSVVLNMGQIGGGGGFFFIKSGIAPLARQIGGDIPRTGLYLMHRGEVVIPAWKVNQLLQGKSQGISIGPVNVSVNVDRISNDVDVRDMAYKIADVIIREIKSRGGGII